MTEDRAEVHIIGVATAEKSNQLEVLIETGETLYIDSEMWKPYDEDLEKATAIVSVKIKGKHTTDIKKREYLIYSYFVLFKMFLMFKYPK